MSDGQLVLRLELDLGLGEEDCVVQLESEVLDEPEERWDVLHRSSWATDGG